MTRPPAFEFSFFDSKYRTLPPDAHDSFLEIVSTEEAEVRAEQDFLRDYELPKTSDFLQIEYDVNAFYENLGFLTHPSVHIVEDDPEDLLGLRHHAPTIARSNPFTYSTVVRHSRLVELGAYDDPVLLRRIVSHEEAHSLDATGHVTLKLQEDQSLEPLLFSRKGFDILAADRDYGRLLEEGFAEYLAMLCQRAAEGDDRPLGFNGVPPAEVPGYFGVPDEHMVAGPDGYIMELLGYGMAQKGFVSLEQYRELLLDTRRDETKTVALRTFIQGVEGIEKGLYPMLKHAQYGRAEWSAVQCYVHDRVKDL